MERLCDLHFTWGEKKLSAIESFSRGAGMRGQYFQAKASMQLEHDIGLDLYAPRRLESLRHACLYIDALAMKADALGLRLICNGEDDQWAYFYAVNEVENTLLIDYTYTYCYGKRITDVPERDIFGTALTEDDVRNLTVGESHIHGIDIDGERFEIFFGAPLCVEAREIASRERSDQDD